MRKPRVTNTSLFPNASLKASHFRIEPIVPNSQNRMPMHDHVFPHHQASGNIEEVSSLETILKIFWDSQMEQLQYFKGFNRNNHLPLTRIRKILKSDPEVNKITWDAPVLFAQACEYFILELTLRAWMHTISCNRQTIRRRDVFEAVKSSEIYGFLIDLVHFGPQCPIYQAAPPPPEMILPDMNIPIDMNQTEQSQENLVNKTKGFDLNCDLKECTCGSGFCSEHDSTGRGGEAI